MAPVIPEVLWAQRSSGTDESKNMIYLTINATDVAKPSISLSPASLSYSGTSASGKEYAIEIEFFEEIEPEKSTYHTTGRDSFFILRKKATKDEFWPRLLKDKRKMHWLKTDFDKWVDEDEQEDKPADDFSQYGGGLDFSSLQNDLGSALGGGAGGMGGMGDLGALGGLGGLGGMGGLAGGAAGPGLGSMNAFDDSDDDEYEGGEEAKVEEVNEPSEVTEESS
ncbi:HSP20-like chaperone [Lipomyces oligophaga]|uniref:HSP20-like chaperone n=1 Tax=Lipomyces oligophaga TaxID=45792 RepID=UPI0034CD7DE4